MIKLMPIVEQIQQDQLEEAGVKDIALGTAMAASSMFGGGAKAQAKLPTDKPAITQQASTTKTNPGFWVNVNDTNDIKKVQTAMKAYRVYTLALWKVDKAIINDMDKFYSELTPQERIDAEKRYMGVTQKTDADGLNGEFTSNFIFPTSFLKYLNSGEIKNLGLEGNKVLQLISQSGLTIQQMAEWNQFVKWMKEQKYAGDKKMNNFKFSNSVLQKYKS